MVAYHVTALHRREDLWGPDADEYRPERWTDEIFSWVRASSHFQGSLALRRIALSSEEQRNNDDDDYDADGCSRRTSCPSTAVREPVSGVRTPHPSKQNIIDSQCRGASHDRSSLYDGAASTALRVDLAARLGAIYRSIELDVHVCQWGQSCYETSVGSKESKIGGHQ